MNILQYKYLWISCIKTHLFQLTSCLLVLLIRYKVPTNFEIFLNLKCKTNFFNV